MFNQSCLDIWTIFFSYFEGCQCFDLLMVDRNIQLKTKHLMNFDLKVPLCKIETDEIQIGIKACILHLKTVHVSPP